MGFKVTKNTIPQGLSKAKTIADEYSELAIKRGLEAIRSSIVPITPVISGRLKGSVQGAPKKEGDSINEVKKENTKWIGKIGSRVEYAMKVEMNSKKNRGFFKRGFESAKGNVISIIKNTLKEGINKNKQK
jgi:hypothetical protein